PAGPHFQPILHWEVTKRITKTRKRKTRNREPGSQIPFGNLRLRNSVSRARHTATKRSFGRRGSQTEFGKQREARIGDCDHFVFRLSCFRDSLLSSLHLRAPSIRNYRNQSAFTTIPMARVYTSVLITEFSHRVMLLGLAKR